jgi:hypothetical protein
MRGQALSITGIAPRFLVSEAYMASSRQRSAARKNVRKAATAAKRKKTISKLPKSTRTALGKQGSKMAKRKR